MTNVVSQADRLYTDGGSVGPNPSPYGAPFAWCFVSPEDDILLTGDGMLLPNTEGLPRYQQRPWYTTYVLEAYDPELGGRGFSNNLSEMAGPIDALRFMPDGWSGTIVSDSDVTLGRLFRNWNWKATASSAGLPEAWHREWKKHRARLGGLRPLLVAGHPTREDLMAGTKRGLPVSKFNAHCDRVCGTLITEFRKLKGI